MRAAVLKKANTVELIDVSLPAAQPGGLVVEVDRCAIGGSDLLAWRSGDLPGPAWFGHAWSGRVVDVGADTVGHFVGERVVGAAPAPCGECKHCRAGFPENCDRALEMILGADSLASPHGAFAECIHVDARRVAAIPEGVDDNDAALAEPAAVAVHAVDRAELRLGDIVVVIGAGTIGLIVAELARIAGASRVLAVDPAAHRRELACDLGAHAAFAPGEDVERWLDQQGHGLGADVVFECVGAEGALARAVDLVRRGGMVLAVGVSGQSTEAVPAALVEREVTVRASLGYTAADVRRTLALLAEDRLRVEGLYDPNPIGLDAVGPTLHALDRGDRAGRTVLVAPNG